MNMADRIADLSALWKQASMVFPYFDREYIDWDQAYRAYLPKVIAAKSQREFHLLLAEFMNLLGDGHTDYLPPKTLRDETGYLPFTLRSIREVYCIDGVIPMYRAYLGAQAVSINGLPFAQLIQKAARYSYHVGTYIPHYALHRILPFLLKPTENRMETTAGELLFDLLPEAPEGLQSQKQELSEAYRSIRTGKPDIRLYDGGILYVRLDDFLCGGAAEEIRAALEQTPAAGMVMDLRENIGGMTMYGAKVAELLISGVFHGCKKRTRSMTGIGLASASQIMQWSEEEIRQHIAAGNSSQEEIEQCRSLLANTHYDEYVDTYGGEGHAALFDRPCVALTSRRTVSAAEDFVAMLRTNRRAVIVGAETCGTTGTPLMQKLSCGGWMRVCSVGYRLLDGTEFIGCGIKPDIYCELTPEDLRRGCDPVLERGMEVVRELIRG